MGEPPGPALRRLRNDAGLSLTELARELRYHKSYLSKVETGRQKMSEDLARQCDRFFDTGGTFLAEAARGREALRAPARKTAPSTAGTGLNATSVRAYAAILDAARRTARISGPSPMLDSLAAQARALERAAAHGPERERPAILAMAARFAEFTGWLYQEAGDDRAAVDWTAYAAALAAPAGNADMAAHVLTRQALITLYGKQGEQTIDLAVRAQGITAASARVRGMAAQREAQGHALLGHRDDCLRALDRADSLLGTPPPDDAASPLGPASLPAQATLGWCRYDLGDHAGAARTLDEAIGAFPAGYSERGLARFGVRRALAYARMREVEHACELTRGLLDTVMAVDSATIRADLRTLNAVLARRSRNQAARDLLPDLARALAA